MHVTKTPFFACEQPSRKTLSQTRAGEIGRAHCLGRDDQEGKHVHKPVAELPGAVCRRSQPEERRTHSVPPKQAYERPEGAIAARTGI